MNKEKKIYTLSAISGVVGAIFGALSGSNNPLIVGIVAAVVSLITTYAVKGMLR